MTTVQNKIKQIQAHLENPLAPYRFVFGILKGTDVLAFGKSVNGNKIRLGSINWHEGNDEYQVLSIDSRHEFRSSTMNHVYWFLHHIDNYGGDWDAAELWIRS